VGGDLRARKGRYEGDKTDGPCGDGTGKKGVRDERRGDLWGRAGGRVSALRGVKSRVRKAASGAEFALSKDAPMSSAGISPRHRLARRPAAEATVAEINTPRNIIDLE
jgi:hypothetical protein